MWLGRGAWQPYEISHAHDRRSIGKSVLSLMGLMRTDPPFLRRENKVVKEKKQSEKSKERN
jgi:hypothetical protein